MRSLVLIFTLFLTGLAHAGPEPYRLDVASSFVSFVYMFSGNPTRGNMTVSKARILLDIDNPANSEVAATIDADKATAGMFLATSAMKGPQVLDTNRFPTITFESSRVIPDGQKARIEGLITIRDVTRPITLNAQVFRQQGTQPGDRDRMSIKLHGEISRAAFGAGGFADLVGDTIILDIIARVDRIR